MDYTLFEISKHKLNINTLSNKLINTFDINEEISINNEIKKETEFLLTLLNMKKIQMNTQILQNTNINNNMNFNNQMINNPFILNNNQFNQQQPIQERILEEEGLERMISITFEYPDDKDFHRKTTILCGLSDKMSDVIEKYRNKVNDRDNNDIFIYNASAINTSFTVAESGIFANTNIKVIKFGRIKG